MILPGRATAEGTRRYFQRIHRSAPDLREESWYCRIPSIDLTVSRIGFGTYRVHRDQPEHHEALRESLLSGFNVIDTAPGYSDGSAEVLTGNVLQELVRANRIHRDEVVIVDRVGFIEESTLRLLRDRLPRDTVELGPSLCYSIHPDFIEMQIEWSRQRLGVDCIDFLLLHNPEMLLQTGVREVEYLRRIRDSLDFLEKLRSQELISCYGISSNAMVTVEGRRHLETILQFAPPGFRALQFPANLVETEYRRTGLLQLAAARGLWTMANRPLNAIPEGSRSVLRLARPVEKTTEGEDNPVARQIRKEEELKDLEDIMLELCNEKGERFAFEERSPAASAILRHYQDRIPGPEDIYPLIQALTPLLQQTASRLQVALSKSSDPHRGRLLLERYLRLIHSSLGSFPAYCLYKNGVRMERLENWIREKGGPDLPLALQAIQGLLADGIQTVLVGMRRVGYVRQIQGIAALRDLRKIPDLPESLLQGPSGG